MQLLRKEVHRDKSLQNIRKTSLVSAKKLGYEVNPALPLLDNDLKLRSQEEIVARSLAIDESNLDSSDYGYRVRVCYGS